MADADDMIDEAVEEAMLEAVDETLLAEVPLEEAVGKVALAGGEVMVTFGRATALGEEAHV